MFLSFRHVVFVFDHMYHIVSNKCYRVTITYFKFYPYMFNLVSSNSVVLKFSIASDATSSSSFSCFRVT